VISQINVPEYFLLPKTCLPISFEVMGANSVEPGSHDVVASLTTAEGQSMAQQKQDLAGQRVVVLDTSLIPPGHYQLCLKITDARGELCSRETRNIKAILGPDSDTRW
jgi:hypothetical protein